jgi:hypothetical protein
MVGACWAYTNKWEAPVLFGRHLLAVKCHLKWRRWKDFAILFSTIKCRCTIKQAVDFWWTFSFFPLSFLPLPRISRQSFKNLNVSYKFIFVMILVLIFFYYHLFCSWCFLKVFFFIFIPRFFFHLIFVSNLVIILLIRIIDIFFCFSLFFLQFCLSIFYFI